MDKAETVDPNTVKFTFKVPAPRFFWQLTYHFDIGVYIIPKHIFERQDSRTFTHFDLAKGWPVTTGPWRVVALLAAAEDPRPRRRLVGRQGRRRASCPQMERYILPARPGRAAARSEHHQERIRLHHRHPADQLPDGLQGQPEGDVLDRRQDRRTATSTGGRTRCTSTASGALERQERPLGAQLLH